MNDISPLTDKAKLIEVILFIENGPLTVDRIKELSGVDKEDIPACLTSRSTARTENHRIYFKSKPTGQWSLPKISL